MPTDAANGSGPRPKVGVTIRPPANPSTATTQQNGKPQAKKPGNNTGGAGGQPNNGVVGIRPEDKPDTPEYKKKQAMLKGPILELAQEHAEAYGMDECTFTGLKDIFLALIESQSRMGVLSPQRFLEIFKRDNEMFRNSMHQDAHEFYGLVLNDVINNVEANARKMQALQAAALTNQQPLQNGHGGDNGLSKSMSNALGLSNHVNGSAGRIPGTTGWVHDIFEGLLTSETQCLSCGTASQRDETFLDLSIDLEEHSSVTSCLRKFSDDEMLCERNKFHCDACGGLQEAEKRMKVKRLPRVLTLHLKRFKYTEDYSRLQKLFHRVVYPYHLRMFNTTDDAEDPDRLYELYAVVVHIGGNAYHGHYVSIIKTRDRGWVLFDDEMVEPVDKHFVRNFFGDKPGTATAYVLFYQETTFEKVRQEHVKEGMEEVKLANQAAHLATEDGEQQQQQHQNAAPRTSNATAAAAGISTEPSPARAHNNKTSTDVESLASPAIPASTSTPTPASASIPTTPAAPAPAAAAPSKEDRKREKKEREAAEKAGKLAEKERKEQAKQEAKQDERRQQAERLRTLAARRNEDDELQRAMEASKRSARESSSSRKPTPSAGTGAVTPSASSSDGTFGFLDRSKRGSKSMAKRSVSFLRRDKGDQNHTHTSSEAPPPLPEEAAAGASSNGAPPDGAGHSRRRGLSTLGRKKSTNLMA